jgi:hypothetical protein
MLVSSPITLLSGFMMAAVVLYSFFSFKFYRTVLQQQKTVRLKLRDWVRVNGIVTLIFSVITVLNVLLLLQSPEIFLDAMQKFGVEVPLKSIQGFLYVMLLYGSVLFIHVVWTFALLKKNKHYFE